MQRRAGDGRTIIMIIIIYGLRVQFSPMWGSLRLAPMMKNINDVTIPCLAYFFFLDADSRLRTGQSSTSNMFNPLSTTVSL